MKATRSASLDQRKRPITGNRLKSNFLSRGFDIEVGAETNLTRRLDIPIDAADLYLPPFRIRGDVLSGDAPGLGARLDEVVVMGNARVLIDDGSNPVANWFTTGTDRDMHEWLRWWLHAEAQRGSALLQRSARLGRVEVEPYAPDPDGDTPWRGPTALRIAFDGNALVYRGGNRHLPGNPYRLGLWVKGDGSGAELRAMFLDYTEHTGYNWNSWRRVEDGERTLCKLDFTGWRYVEVDLPGDGLGENSPRGSTAAVDYPLEWTYLEIVPAEAGPPAGMVHIGAAYVTTQQPRADMLALHVGYAAADDGWTPAADGWFTLQNAAVDGPCEVDLDWRLTDRSGATLASGRMRETVEAGTVWRQALPLSAHAETIADRTGPFRLSVEAVDRANPAVRAEAVRMLAHPDSEALLTDFEQERGYRRPPHVHGAHEAADAEGWAASTSSLQARSGTRALALPWDMRTRPATTVSIDPELPGIPTAIRMWVHGDGSGALLHPFVGDRTGVSHSWRWLHHNIFHLRSDEWDDDHAVTVDWEGWREVRFRLPPIPAGWNEEFPVRGFVPNYPLGLHLSVMAPPEADDNPRDGMLFVDDIRVLTHLEPDARVAATWTAPRDGNRIAPGAPLEVLVRNADRRTAHTVQMHAALRDWRGDAVASVDTEVTLDPLTSRLERLVPTAPEGAYQLQLELARDGAVLGTVQQDVIVADAKALEGEAPSGQLSTSWDLRRPLGEGFQELDEDWDWIEPFPGNTQFMSMRQGIETIRAQGGEPWMRLGYSAYWAAGIGFESFQSGHFQRPPRDAGSAVGVLQPPARIEDWDAFVAETMRATGDAVEGWLLWDGPDAASGPLALSPEFFSRLLGSVDRWRKRYAPDRPVLAGGLSRHQAIDWLLALNDTDVGLAPLDGVHVRMDVGRNSPEDAQVVAFVQTLHELLGVKTNGRPKQVLLTELDWAVEQDGTPDGLGVFEQAAYLARTELLLLGQAARTVVDVRNADATRLGLGLAYRRLLYAPPMREPAPAYWLKPAWVGLRRLRERLSAWGVPREENPRDRIPDRTRCLVFDGSDRSMAAVWRLDGPGEITFEGTGLAVQSATDLFGTPATERDRHYPVGIVPVFFELDNLAPPGALLRARIRTQDTPHWTQDTLAIVHPAGGATDGYRQQGATPATLADWRPDGLREVWPGARFEADGEERFELAVPAGSGLALVKRFLIDADHEGHVAVIQLPDGDPITWDLRRTSGHDEEGGLREALLTLPADALGTATEGRTVPITVRYPAGAAVARWTALAWRGEPVSLTQLGIVSLAHPDLRPRLGRNVAGGPLRVGDTRWDDGIGTYAPAALTFALGGRYSRLTGAVGVDALTEGRGAVRFEVLGDGRRLWVSPVLTGLDEPLDFDIEVTDVDRLHLVATDAAEGAGMGVANWGDAMLHD
jgi:hypothetical protein